MSRECRIYREYRYDAENQLISVSYETGLTVQYTYDKAGNRILTAVVPGETPQTAISVRGEGGLQETPAAGVGSQIPGLFFCPICNTPITHGKKFCSNCGAPVSTPDPAALKPPSVCQKCGQQLKAGTKFCNSCGTKIV